MKRILSLICAVVLAMTALTFAASADGMAAFVNCGNGKPLNIRSSMLTHCNNRVASLEDGHAVTILSVTGDWSYIQFVNPANGRTMKGYCQSRYLKSGSAPTSYETMTACNPTTVWVRPTSPTGHVKMRSGATKQASVIARFPQGYALTMTAHGKSWALVYDPNSGNSGYMMLDFLAY